MIKENFEWLCKQNHIAPVTKKCPSLMTGIFFVSFDIIPKEIESIFGAIFVFILFLWLTFFFNFSVNAVLLVSMLDEHRLAVTVMLISYHILTASVFVEQMNRIAVSVSDFPDKFSFFHFGLLSWMGSGAFRSPVGFYLFLITL